MATFLPFPLIPQLRTVYCRYNAEETEVGPSQSLSPVWRLCSSRSNESTHCAIERPFVHLRSFASLNQLCPNFLKYQSSHRQHIGKSRWSYGGRVSRRRTAVLIR